MSRKSFFLFLKGMALGLSMLLPGISGGSMAFILGIYQKLIQEIARFKPKYFKSFFMGFSFKPAKVKKHFLVLKKAWDWLFLIPLITGSFFSVWLFVMFASDKIADHFLLFYSLIFGLVLGSLISPFKQIKKSFPVLALFLLSFVLNSLLFAYGKNLGYFSGEIPVYLFVPVGFLVSMTLIIPGISGSYLLLILGLYEKTLLALKQAQVLVIVCFTFGVFLGFVVTAKGIQKMLKKYGDQSLAVILGLMAGSLSSLYPLNLEGLKGSISWVSSPLLYQKEQGQFIAYASLGFIVILLLDFLGKQKA